MKEISVVFKEKFTDLTNLLKEKRYENCLSIAKDMTKISATFELKDEVFISETLEGIFDQMDDLMDEYEVPEKDKDALADALLKHMQEFVKHYESKNITKVYDELKEMRYTATIYQLAGWHKYKTKERYGPRGRI